MTNPETPAVQNFSRRSNIRDPKSGGRIRYYTAGSLDEAIKATLQSKSDSLRVIPGERKTVIIDPMKGVDPEMVASLGGRIISIDELGPDPGPLDPLRFGK